MADRVEITLDVKTGEVRRELEAVDARMARLIANSGKATEALTKAFGGGEITEKVRDMSRAFEMAGDRSLDLNSRMTAFAAGAANAARTLAAVGRQALEAAERFAEFSRRANSAEQTQFSQWLEDAKLKAERFALSIVRLGEAQASINPVHIATARLINAVVSATESATRVADSLATRVRQLSNGLHDLTRGALGTARQTEAVKESMGGAAGAAASLTTKVGDLGARFANAASSALLFKTAIEAANNAASVDFGARHGETPIEYRARILDQARAVIRRNAQQDNTRRGAAEILRAEHAGTGAQINAALGIAGTSGGSVQRRPGESYDAAVRRYQEQAERNAANVAFTSEFNARAGQERQRDAMRAQFYSPAGEAQRRQTSAAAMARGAAEGDAVNARFQRRFDVGEQLTTAMEGLAPTAARTQTIAENLGETVSGAFDKMGAAASGFFEALMSGEDAGEAFKKMIHGLMKGIALESGVKALLAGAEGVFRIARSYGADPTGYALLGNAAMWAGVAAATGVVAAVTAPTPHAAVGNAAAAGAASMPRATARGPGSAGAGGGGGDGGTTVINISGDVFAGTAFQDWLRTQQRAQDRRGLQAA